MLVFLRESKLSVYMYQLQNSLVVLVIFLFNLLFCFFVEDTSSASSSGYKNMKVITLYIHSYYTNM